MRRRLAVLILALAVFGLSATSARAEIAQFTLGYKGIARYDGTALVHGQIKCSSNTNYTVRVTMTRNGVTLVGSTGLRSCAGDPQGWHVVAKGNGPAVPGQWRTCAIPTDRTGDKEPLCHTVTLYRP